MNLTTFRSRIRSAVLPYYKANNAGHQIDHADQVCDDALEINQRLAEPMPEHLVIAGAYYHDAALAEGRVGHETRAGDLVRSNVHPALHQLTTAEREQVACACAEHRASYKGNYTSMLSEIVSAADRGKPRPVEAICQRLYSCYKHLSEQECLDICVAHLKDKYGTDGYARYNDTYRKLYGQELQAHQERVDLVTHETFNSYLA